MIDLQKRFPPRPSPNGPTPDQQGDAYEGQPTETKPSEPQEGPEPPPPVETFTAAELMAMELPEPRWAVEGILPEGLCVLAGKPKLGKSWLALNLALAVAEGGVVLGQVPVEPGRVLYLALEDTKRRLKGRLGKLLARTEAAAPGALTMARTWPRQDGGGWLALEDWLDRHPETRLVIIDTWPKFRPLKKRGDDYQQDYDHAAEVKKLADRYGVTILIIAHCRKLEAEDPVDSVSGTLGLTGVADAVLVLRRERGQHDAALFVSGRDVEEEEHALQWDPAYCLWSLLGKADDYRLSKERQAAIDLLGRAGKPLTPTEAAPLLGKKPNAVKFLLWSMAKDGQVTALGDGTYTTKEH
ncbi:MAG: helicase RepA family protein [Gemmataceae bacterium]|nr:helicase RepA family protein [Gemmataceae bacterium]